MIPIVTLDALFMSWTLQATLGVVLLIAFLGMTRVFEGAPIRSIALGWSAFLVLMATSAAYAFVSRLHDAGELRLAFSAVEDVARVFMLFFWYPTAPALAGRPLPRRSWRWYGAAFAGALVFTIVDLTLDRYAPALDVNVIEHLYPAAWAYLAFTAWRLARTAERNGPTLRWLAFGYSLYVVRVELAKVLVHDQYAQATTRNLLVVAAVQVAHVAAFGVICLVVALALERARILRQTEQLRDAEARLMNARRLASLGELAARIAHDFNNALTVILGGIELAGSSLESPEETSALLTDVADAAGKSRGLIAQLLAFGRPTRSDDGQCDVRSFLEQRTRDLVRLAAPASTVIVTAPSVTARVGLDPVMLERILFNLVANARDAMPGGGTIHVEGAIETLDGPRASLGGQLPSGPYVRLAVEDTGTGIPPEVREKIFEPFFTTKGSAGTGLGLATVYAIVTQAKGDVILTSEVGKGTRFELFLPAVP